MQGRQVETSHGCQQDEDQTTIKRKHHINDMMNTADRKRVTAHSQRQKREASQNQRRNLKRPTSDSPDLTRCFHCNPFGHMAAACTDKVHQVNLAEQRSSIGQWPGRIGKHETTALRIDTGATISVVHRKLISDEELTGRQVAIKPRRCI